MTAVPGAVKVAPGLFVSAPAAPPSPAGAGLQVLSLHGCGVVDGHFIADADDAQSVLSARGSWDVARLGGEIRGVLTLYLWDPVRHAIHVVPDPWGGLVHRYTNGDLEAASSDLGALVDVLASLGRVLQPSLDFATEVAAVSSGGLNPSSYEGIEVLDILQWLEMTSERSHTHTFSVREQILTPFASYDEGLDAIAAEVERNITAVANFQPTGPGSHRTSHLTGGLDTRMILAATRHLGLTDSFSYLSLGPRTTPDKQIAERLATEVGLTMTNHVGIVARHAPRSITEQALWPMDFSHGLLTTGPHAFQDGSRTVVMSGGFGGYMKGNYSKALLGAPPLPGRDGSAALTQTLWGAKAFSTDPDVGLYSKEMVNRRVDRFHDLRTSAEALGLSPESALDWLFMRVRNRYFLAETSRVWNSHLLRFDPLYSLSGARLALSLDSVERAANVVVLDLMRRWSPQLLGLPFDNERISTQYESLRGHVPRHDFSVTSAPPTYDDRPAPTLPADKRVDLVPDTPEVLRMARALQAPLWQVRDLEPARVAVRQVVDELAPGIRQSVFNSKTLHGLLRWELKHRGLVRQVHNLHSTLVWYGYALRGSAERQTTSAANEPREASEE